MFHTVYLSFEDGPDGRNYIGKHSTTNPYDDYMGSSLDPTFSPVGKIVLGIFKSPEAAVAAEIQWQRVFDVVQDSSFANRAFQTASGFDTTGRKRPSHECRPGGLTMKGKLVWNNGVVEVRSPESPGPEWKRGHLSENFKNGHRFSPKGTHWWVSKTGENKRSKESPGPDWKRGRTWQEH